MRFQLIVKTNQPKPHLERCFSTWRLLSCTSLCLASPSPPHSPWPDFSSHSLADILIDFTEVLRASCCLHLVGIFQSFPHQTSLPHVSLLFVFLLDAADRRGVTTGSRFRAPSLCVIRPLVLGVTHSVILGPLSSAELVLKLPHPPLNPLFFLYPVWWHHIPSQKSGSLPTTSSPTSCDEKFPDSISSTYQVYPLFKKKKKHLCSLHSNLLGFSLTTAFGLPPVLFP